MKVAITHDWLVGGGAELVVEQLHKLYPEAPIYTSTATKEWKSRLDGKVITGYLDRWPLRPLRKYLAPLRALWFSRLDLREYDLIISSKGNGEASYVRRLAPSAKHICYCHSPTHFYWRKYDAYIESPGFGLFNPLARLGLRLLVKPLRRWDYRAMRRPDVIIANSTNIQKEIKKSYNRKSEVVFPPVDTGRFKAAKVRKDYYVTGGRQVPYKRHDIAVAACSKLNIPLKVLGHGPENQRLKQLAGPSVEFIDSPSNSQIEQAFSEARGFIHAAEEDFGIMPVEALSAGCPVIAYGAGGALDYVQDGKNGLLVRTQNAEAFAAKLNKQVSYTPAQISKSAQKFSDKAFWEEFRRILSKT